MNLSNTKVISLKQSTVTRPMKQLGKGDIVRTRVAQPMMDFREEKKHAHKQDVNQQVGVGGKKNETARLVCPKSPLVSYSPAEKILAYFFMSVANVKSFGGIKHPM